MRWIFESTVALAVAAVMSGIPVQAGAADTAPRTAGIKTVASVMDVMKTMTIPFSDAVFNAGAEPPTTDKAWADVRDRAVALAEAGNLLMIGTRVKDHAAWMKFSRAQVDAADAAAKAAAAKNADQLSSAADALYETCASCHKVYLPN